MSVCAKIMSSNDRSVAMIQRTKETLADAVRQFHLPRFEEIPDVGLYLEQVAKYANDCLAPLENVSLTSSMISNYVKRGLVPNPVKKLYNREQIAYLLYIAVVKNALSLDNIGILFDMQRRTHEIKAAYDYFCTELEEFIFYVFGLKDSVKPADSNASDEKMILRNTIIAVAHQTYLNMCLRAIQSEQASDKP